MLQMVPQFAVLNYVVLITVQLKWTWDYLLHQSFNPNGVGLPEYIDNDLSVTIHENDDSESGECAVCLCRIEEGDEVRELRCEHLFHRPCLDRWLGYGHMTCPLCRNNLRLPPLDAAELHHELIVIDFGATRYSDRCVWWLR